MNLLKDAWIPVKKDGEPVHISMEELLCSDSCFMLSHRRDDMELAALQLLISLAQCVFTPQSKGDWMRALKSPMPKETYSEFAEKYIEWFSLDDIKYPFMQDRDAKDEVLTGIQKLFPGMPEGDGSATLFVDDDAITKACPSCTALALFNQATCAPSFGGGTKGPLRGSAPVTLFVYSENLREMVWRNVFTADWAEEKNIELKPDDKPVWVDKLKRGSKISTASIGIFRGLFWQPAFLCMDWQKEEESICPCCGRKNTVFCEKFHKNKFVYELTGPNWIHPHSPYTLDEKANDFSIVTFNRKTNLPLWSRIPELLPCETNQVSSSSAVKHYVNERRKMEHLPLVVGGYKNQKASITGRRHEIFSVASAWVSDSDKLEKLNSDIGVAMSFHDIIRKKSYFFGKAIDQASKIPDAIAQEAGSLFFQRTEALMHSYITQPDESATTVCLARSLKTICEDIFEEVASPYVGSPKGLKSYSLIRNELSNELYKIVTNVSPRKAEKGDEKHHE